MMLILGFAFCALAGLFVGILMGMLEASREIPAESLCPPISRMWDRKTYPIVVSQEGRVFKASSLDDLPQHKGFNVLQIGDAAL